MSRKNQVNGFNRLSLSVTETQTVSSVYLTEPGVCPAGVTKWVKNWKLNGWRLKSGGKITNKDDFVILDQLNAELEVVWVNTSLNPFI